ncbi:MAG: 23S rRNA (guanosine-2'-O-)-methyltransferase RlmB [Chlamydiia bacterium]|nr:23S rRNA (guanosine-2'-O-)-methyltransferase RlmB [Chlamydiia bacterium]
MRNHGHLIMGKNPIEELLKKDPSRFIEVITSSKSKDDPLFSQIKAHHIPIQFMGKNQLSDLVGSDSHQSFVARVKRRPEMSIGEFLQSTESKTDSCILMLDSIYDPQNLGTIYRAAECYGVDLIIFSKNRGSNLTPAATKASVGATELIPTCIVSNLANTLKELQDNGYWAMTTNIGKQAQNLHTFEFPEKSLIIMGSEGEGVQPLLTKKADFQLYIPMHGQIDSLNVSQATAVILNSYRTQHHSNSSHS